MNKRNVQLTLPIFDDAIPDAVVEVVEDVTSHRLRVRPVNFVGWVKFPKRLRELGAIYRVDLLKPRPGGAWAAVGNIRRLAI